MNKAVLATAFGLVLSVSAMTTLATAGSVGHGDFGVYKGGQLADKLSGQNPIDEGALLVCDGKCMIKSEGVSLVAADQAKLAIRNEAKTFNLFLREGNVNYTITSDARQVAFHTPQGTYTTAEVIFNAAANPVVRGYARVNADGATEIGVEEGRLVFATADGMKTVDANQKIVLAVSEVPAPAGGGEAAAGGAGFWSNPANRTVVFGGVLAAGITTFVIADNDDDDDDNQVTPPAPVEPEPMAPVKKPVKKEDSSRPAPPPIASPNV
jgi:hypothetical protein